jgi:YidC/Oxa1 family membrane protein insertase
MQTRVVIAIVTSFLFFVIYDTYFLPQSSLQNTQTQTSQTQTQKDINQAPANSQSLNSQNTPPAKHSEFDKILTVVNFHKTTWQIDSLGRVAQVTLKEKKFNKKNNQLHLFDEKSIKPLEMRFSDSTINDLAFKTPFSASSSEIDVTNGSKDLVLKQKLGDLEVIKKITFYPDGHYDLHITLNKDFKYFITTGFRPSAEVDVRAVHGLLIKEFDNTITVIEDSDAKGTQNFKDAKIVSAFDKYYATLFYNNKFNVIVSQINDNDPLSFVQGSRDFKFSGYIGPKYVDLLTSLNPELKSAVEYGFFTFISAPLFSFLNYLFKLTGNWAWAIVLLTITVRVILFPLSAKGMMSMHKLKVLSPQIKELQAKYKKDPQQLQVKMMELYKKHGANPLGGCLPFILQIPIFFAIYRVLVNAIEIKGAQWLYIDDLSLMDPYYILPILMGVSMFVQQKITPSNITDPMQEKIFKYLPVIFTLFFFTFPAGLVLYWLVNNILSILQQYIINKKLETGEVAK